VLLVVARAVESQRGASDALPLLCAAADAAEKHAQDRVAHIRTRLRLRWRWEPAFDSLRQVSAGSRTPGAAGTPSASADGGGMPTALPRLSAVESLSRGVSLDDFSVIDSEFGGPRHAIGVLGAQATARADMY
jgi:hypothetical protein